MFREHEVSVCTDNAHLRPSRVFKVPRAMALVVPDDATDVPSAIEFRARRGADRFECVCRAEEVAQVLIPAETRLGTTVFNEVIARSTVEAVIGGEQVRFSGPSILEFIREY
jgi:hypothetical protein